MEFDYEQYDGIEFGEMDYHELENLITKFKG